LAAVRLRAPVDFATLDDRELVRGGASGIEGAFAELYRRHAPAAHHVARGVVANPDDAADAVGDAFARVFGTIARTRRADLDFRPYLLAATRNAAIDHVRRAGRLAPAGDLADADLVSAGAGPSETLVAGESSQLVARAFSDLPDRWQSVLWLTEVEGVPAREAAGVLGLSPNNVSQLAVRARARLLERYLQAHVRNHAHPGCQATVDRLGAYLAGTLATGHRAQVVAHLADCGSCRARLEEIEDVGSALRRAVLPVPVALVALADQLRRAAPGPGVPRGEHRRPRRFLLRRPAVVERPLAEGQAMMTTGAPVVQALGTSPVAAMAPVIVAAPAQHLVARAASAILAVVAAIVPGLGGGGGTDVAVPPRPAEVVHDVVAAAPPSTEAPAPATTEAAAPPAPAPAPAAVTPRPDPGPLPATSHPHSTVAEAVGPRVAVYDQPGAGAPSLDFANPQPSGAPLVFLVEGSQDDWLQVLLPTRPNGSMGWVRSEDVSVSTHDFSIVVELGAHRITAFQGTEPFLSEPIAVGTADMPTPGGLYYTKELIQPLDAAGRLYPGGPYGPYAYGLSGFSDVLTSFGGGDGVIGIHGTNDPSSLGHDVSHGCIRMSNRGITTLAETLPPGVPVEVRP
jgi:RNA polymerase sigma factor (sigma-70 family)